MGTPCTLYASPIISLKTITQGWLQNWVSANPYRVTNLPLPSRAVVRFYHKRGTAEQWIKEGKRAVKMTRLSCHRVCSNEVRLTATCNAHVSQMTPVPTCAFACVETCPSCTLWVYMRSSHEYP